MTRYYVEITCLVSGLNTAQIDGLFDNVAEAVYALSDVMDADLGQRGELLDFTMALDADDEPAALTSALSAVRSAIHAAGGSTPGWEKHFESIQQIVRRESALLPA